MGVACRIDTTVSGQRTLFRTHPVACRTTLISLVLVALALGYLGRYRSFVRSLRAYDVAIQDGFASQNFPLLDRHQITQLGSAHRPGARPENSYTLVEREIAPGTLRIGIFGCSFVMGSEAAPGQDFPSHLQRLFDADGKTKVEVANFGVGAFGVQQSYLLWQYLAGDFDLDFTIYDLYGFHRLRDNTFIMLNTVYAPVHARYVLDGEGLRLIEVMGDDRSDAAARYFRLLPRWDTLRYDAKTPPQIRALLPPGRELPANPMYYQRDRNREIVDLYQRIFTDMGNRSRNFLVLLNDKRSVDLARSGSPSPTIGSARTSTEKFTWARSSFYRAPNNHPSALGYLVHAEEVHALLNQRREAELPDIEILEAVGATNSAGSDGELSDYDEVFVSLNGLPAAVFVAASDDRESTPYSFRAHSKNSILDVSGGSDARFITLDGAIPGGHAWLGFSVDETPVEIEFGGISFAGGWHIGVLDRSWSATDGRGWKLRTVPHHRDALALEMRSDREITDLRIEAGGIVLLKGTLSPDRDRRYGRISWVSARGDLISTRGHPEQDATAIAASDGGDYCITARKAGSPDETWCTRRWRLTETTSEIERADIPIW